MDKACKVNTVYIIYVCCYIYITVLMYAFFPKQTQPLMTLQKEGIHLQNDKNTSEYSWRKQLELPKPTFVIQI